MNTIDLTSDQHKIAELEAKLERALNIIENRKRSDAKRMALRRDMETALKEFYNVERQPVFDQTSFNVAARKVLRVYCHLSDIDMPTKSRLILDVTAITDYQEHMLPRAHAEILNSIPPTLTARAFFMPRKEGFHASINKF
jgi:hypothetical protein